MKIQSAQSINTLIHPASSANCRSLKEKDSQGITFTAAGIKNPSFVENVLNKNITKKLFKLADANPFAFTAISLAVVGVLLRPVTILALPGEHKEDKQYAAAKSAISASITTAVKILLAVPFGLAIKKLGEKAIANPNWKKFPKSGSPEFQAVNYLLNNIFGLGLMVASSAMMVKGVAIIMKKIMPSTEGKSQLHQAPTQASKALTPSGVKANKAGGNYAN